MLQAHFCVQVTLQLDYTCSNDDNENWLAKFYTNTFIHNHKEMTANCYKFFSIWAQAANNGSMVNPLVSKARLIMLFMRENLTPYIQTLLQ